MPVSTDPKTEPLSDDCTRRRVPAGVLCGGRGDPAGGLPGAGAHPRGLRAVPRFEVVHPSQHLQWQWGLHQASWTTHRQMPAVCRYTASTVHHTTNTRGGSASTLILFTPTCEQLGLQAAPPLPSPQTRARRRWRCAGWQALWAWLAKNCSLGPPPSWRPCCPASPTRRPRSPR